MGYRYSYGEKIGFFVPLVAGVFVVGGLAIGLVDCGGRLNSNRDKLDTVKYFNYYIDYQGDGAAVFKIVSYTDYQGNVVELNTQDGLHILTGLEYAELIKSDNFESVYNRALELSNGKEDLVISYDKLRNLNPDTAEVGSWNKDLWNFDYQFDYALTETDEGVIVRNISQWRDWEEDDKVQFQDFTGTTYLSTFTNTRLVNMSSNNNAEEAIYAYALSLAGSEDKLYGDIDKEHQKVKRMFYTQEVIDEDTNY